MLDGGLGQDGQAKVGFHRRFNGAGAAQLHQDFHIGQVQPPPEQLLLHYPAGA
ncbi:hypothetical protein D3C75_1145970 [compost metagenome]